MAEKKAPAAKRAIPRPGTQRSAAPRRNAARSDASMCAAVAFRFRQAVRGYGDCLA